jgi:hypothetical protein
MVKYVKDEARLNKMLNHTVNNLHQINQIITVASYLREMTKLKEIPKGSDRELATHGLNLLVHINT